MPIENKDVTWVEEPVIGFWEATFLPAIIEGLKACSQILGVRVSIERWVF